VPDTLAAQVGGLVWVLVCLFAVIKGDWPERFAGAFLIAAWIATVFGQLNGPAGRPQYVIMAVDVVVLAMFVVLAWRSQKLWLIWAAGLAAITVASHGAYALDHRIRLYTYAVANIGSSYGYLISLAVGTWQAWRTRERLRQHL
jgi:hypothetical protein